MSGYKATIHTLSVKPVFNTDKRARTKELFDERMYTDARPEYVSTDHAYKTLTINPHKLDDKGDDGKWVYNYWNLGEFLKRMDKIRIDLGLDGYIIKRLDVGVDSDEPYTDTAKVTRLILLLLADHIDADNRYYSVDPMHSNEVEKTLVISHTVDKGKRWTLQAEHYNRELLDQTNWNMTIRNRLEFRAQGGEAGKNYDARAITQRWIDKLDGVLKDWKSCNGLHTVLRELNQDIEAGWSASVRDGLKQSQRNAFIFSNRGSIYTMKQLDALTGSRKNTNNFKRTFKSMERSLLTEGDIESTIQAIREALTLFLGDA